jgi:hypothetical protein
MTTIFIAPPSARRPERRFGAETHTLAQQLHGLCDQTDAEKYAPAEGLTSFPLLTALKMLQNED